MVKKGNDKHERFNITTEEMSERIDGYSRKAGTLGEIENIISVLR